jgi:hypothetical protein
VDGVLSSRWESVDPFAGAETSEAELTFSGANSLDWRGQPRLSIGGGDAYAVPAQGAFVWIRR